MAGLARKEIRESLIFCGNYTIDPLLRQLVPRLPNRMGSLVSKNSDDDWSSVDQVHYNAIRKLCWPQVFRAKAT
jgi:hypothetical protein